MCILPLEHISIQSNHIAGTPMPSVFSEQCSSVLFWLLLSHSLEPTPSGFYLHQSTEIALVKVSSNLSSALFRGQCSACILPDLPATSNPVDRSFLLDKLSSLIFQNTT